MRLLSLHILNFKGVKESRVEFDPVGITVIQGPNEVGKTSLMSAFDVLLEFTDQSHDRRVKATQPVGQDVGTEITAVFAIGADTYTYFKRYHKQAETRLTIDSASGSKGMAGRAAHDHVKDLMETSTDWELWKALKIEQGVTPDDTAKVSLGRSTSLREALDRAAGGNAGAVDDTLFDRVGAEYRRYYTATGKEGKELQEAHQHVKDIEAQVEDLAARVADAERQAERIQRIDKELSQLARDRSEAEREQQALRTALTEIQTLETAQREALRLQNDCREHAAALESQWAERQRLVQDVDDGQARLTKLDARFVDLQRDCDEAKAALAVVNREHQAAEGIAQAARQRFTRLDEDAAMAAWQMERDTLTKQITRVRDLMANCAAWTEERDRIMVTQKSLAAVRHQVEQLNLARAALQVGSPTAVVRPLQPIAVNINGATIKMEPGREERLAITEASVIEVPELLRVEVRPGSSVVELQASLETEANALRGMLESCGAASPGEAEDLLARKTALAEKIAGADHDLAVELDGRNIAELEARRDGLEARLAAYRAGRGADYAFSPTVEDARNLSAEAREAMDDADAAVRRLHPRREAAVLRVGQLEKELTDLVEEITAHTARVAERAEALDRARQSLSDEDLTAQMEGAQTARAAANAQVHAVESELLGKNPERVRMMDEQKRGLIENLANRLAALRTEKAGLEGRLAAIGGQGLSEELEGAKAELEGMRTSWAGLKRRAEAAGTLFAVVKACREEEQSRYREPLRQEIVRIGRVVFGDDFDVVLDDSLTVVSRTGGGAGLPVEALSTGAKEQLALLTRLAAAALVDPSEGMPIILDDTLGHTDDYRMELMTAVLGSVSKGSQIILITSSARRYMALGKAKVVDLWAQSEAGYA